MSTSNRTWLIIILIIFVLASTGCQQPMATPEPEQGSRPAGVQEITDTSIKEKGLIASSTGNPDFAAVAITVDGEILTAITETDASGRITAVTGGVWLSGEGDKVAVYFGENGLPVRAVSKDYVALISNHTNTSADMAVISPAGEIEYYDSVPMDNARILHTWQSIASGGTVKLASLNFYPQGNYASDDFTVGDALTLAEIGFGVFSCAATFGSGGSLGLVFGAGCAGTIVHIWDTLTEDDELPDMQAASTAGHSFACASAVIEKEVTGVGDCAAVVSKVVGAFVDEADVTQQKSAKPIREAAVHLEAPVPTATPAVSLAEEVVGAQCVTTYTRTRKGDDSTESVTVTRTETIVETIDETTVLVQVKYAGNPGSLITGGNWSYSRNLLTGKVISISGEALVHQESITSATDTEVVFSISSSVVVEGWRAEYSGSVTRDPQTYLLLNSTQTASIFDPDGNFWGTDTDKFTLVGCSLP